MELFLEERLTTVNNGEATWYARRDEGSPRTAPDITVEWASEDMTMEWSVLHRLSSDHLPISIEWKKEYEREKKEREVRPNLAKVDWQKYTKTLEGKMTEIGEIRNPKAKYAALEKEILEAARKATPKKVRRKGEEIWMNADIKRVRRERNRARNEWVRKNKELRQLMREAKSRVWKENLEKFEREKDSAGAWALVKRLGGGRKKEGGELIYRNRRCLTERAKSKCFL